MGFVVEALDGRVLDGAVDSLDLPVRPGMVGLGKAMIDVVASASLSLLKTSSALIWGISGQGALSVL
jgi:hypothetical protein